MKATKEVKPTLTLRRVANGKTLFQGWTMTLDTRKGSSFLSEEVLQLWFAQPTDKRTPETAKAIIDKVRESPLFKATQKLSDYPHLLAVGWAMCVKFGFRPCKAIKMFGAGAAAMIADIDAIRKRSSELRTAAKAAGAAMMKTARGGKLDKAKLAAYAKAAGESEEYDKNVRNPAEKKYTDDAWRALAIVERDRDFIEAEREAAKAANA